MRLRTTVCLQGGALVLRSVPSDANGPVGPFDPGHWCVHARRGSQAAAGGVVRYPSRAYLSEKPMRSSSSPTLYQMCPAAPDAWNLLDNNWLLGQVAVGSDPLPGGYAWP